MACAIKSLGGLEIVFAGFFCLELAVFPRLARHKSVVGFFARILLEEPLHRLRGLSGFGIPVLG